jgi:antitoxin MazE
VFAKLDERGSVTIPEELRAGLNSESVLEVVRRDDGVIELRPRDIDPSQAWFWTERWQQMEREADADYAAGRYKTFDDVESFLADLDADSDTGHDG